MSPIKSLISIIRGKSSRTTNEEVIADFWSTNNLSIILITIAISIIILSIFGLYQNEIKPLMNN
ncbi:uncharacterized protein NEPG_01372 [Nematocida parisii ERTm1]|uniref:uncharacterized protein n=1 Tax=Nematocida parisii (strain ERTm1 / ATCC PRA-289) TaxID=881290 RepID=UPI000264B161|nr:uncharacterized protein NEPG_01067 [Nematocida parisii ERTm1]XP_013059200.1 uncharacterized protein NEPG_01372 [Nematocida parisii ERTm1]EIJ93800.1 hypothetical protein NEPG_01372 [Nematocida parisii ERTm1]EIJ94399.1 hypothetical protein NEPG_01067 [Nematocida parisii ERTm1]|eukprot:XP_013058895.1 hypothetical protein NEPG_01067 [Nematocida parisii ERTm1]